MTAAIRVFGFLPMVAVVAAVGCNRADSVEARRQAATSEYPDYQVVGPALIDHACFHAEFGPFGDGAQAYPLAASATPDFPGAAPNLNAVHTFYGVTLPGGAAGAHEGTVKYRPNRTGDWAILVAPDPPVPPPAAGTPAPAPPAPPRPAVPIRVLGPTGAVIPIDLAHDVSGCPRLPRLQVVRLTAGTTYRIVVGPSPVPQVGFVFEKLSDFEAPVFRDSDGDGFGDAEELLSTACVPPAGYVADDRDCDDARANVSPGGTETCDTLDNDCDGQVDEGDVCQPVCVPSPEICNGQDDDCDGQIDEQLTPATCGVGACARTGTTCAASSCTPGTPGAETCNQVDDDCDGEVDEGGVCGPVCTPSVEVCNGADDDCDGQVDEGVGTTFYRDADGDGFGNAADSVIACAAPAGYVVDNGDCNDGAAAVNPQAEEICDGVDNDCSGTADDIEDPVAELSEHACVHAQLGPFVSVSAGSGATAPSVSAPHTAYNVALSGTDGARGGEVRFVAGEEGEYAFMVNPAVPFVVLGPDGQQVDVELELAVNNCAALARLKLVDLAAGEHRLVFGPTDRSEVLLVVERGHHDHEEEQEPGAGGGERDEEVARFFRDADGDGRGNPIESVAACSAPPGYVQVGDDCNDNNPRVHPGAAEVCDQVDNDCDGVVDAVGERPVCQTQCSPIVLEALCGRQGLSAEARFSPPARFKVPSKLPVIIPLRGPDHEATLSWQKGEGSGECRYRAAGREDPRWKLVGCTNGVRAGDTVEANRAELKVGIGCGIGGFNMKLVLPNLACGPTGPC